MMSSLKQKKILFMMGVVFVLGVFIFGKYHRQIVTKKLIKYNVQKFMPDMLLSSGTNYKNIFMMRNGKYSKIETGNQYRHDFKMETGKHYKVESGTIDRLNPYKETERHLKLNFKIKSRKHYRQYSRLKVGNFYGQDLILKRRKNHEQNFTLKTGKIYGQNFSKGGKSFSELLVDTPSCKIPNVDPFKGRIEKPIFINCMNRGPVILTYKDKNRLYINWTAVRLSPFSTKFDKCQTKTIYRPRLNKNHDYFEFVNQSEFFKTSIKIMDEFIKVECFCKNGSKIYTNFYMFFQAKTNKNKKTIGSENKKINVLLIGIDSISRLNSIRYLPKTRDFILNKMGGVEMLGYNKVGDNTFPNIVAMLTGKSIKELPYDVRKPVPLDRFNFLWNNFSRNGYKTLFAEDWPKIAIFDYFKPGFRNIPTDYYNRPYSRAMWKHHALSNTRLCFKGRTEVEDFLEYTTEFVRMYRKSGYFGFTFNTHLTHDSLPKLATADTIYLKFFKSLQKIQTDALTIFFSDHGFRFGRRHTYNSRLEKRLPMCIVIPPESFKSKNQTMYNSLVTNSRRLTSPFDIYKTLEHVLDFKSPVDKNPNTKGYSLFTKIPENRDCENAGIDTQWCACYPEKKLNTSERVVVILAQIVLDNLNRQIKHYLDICEKLKLKNVISGTEIILLNQRLPKNEKVVRLLIQTVPGNAIFEAILRYSSEDDAGILLGDISRLNKYETTADCINNSKLKNICYCKIQAK